MTRRHIIVTTFLMIFAICIVQISIAKTYNLKFEETPISSLLNIYADIKDIELCEGDTITLEVLADGDTISDYQWHNSSGELQGETMNHYILANVKLSNADSYYCVVSNSQGSDTSVVYNVKVNPAFLRLKL